MQDPILQPPLPTPDGHIEEKPFDAAEIFGRPWEKAPWPVRCAAFLGILFYGTTAFFAFIGAIASLRDQQPEAWIALLAGIIGTVLTLWLINGFKQHYRAAWRLQAALWLIGLLLVPIGTVFCLVLLWMWDEKETRAWFGLKIKNKAPRRRWRL